MKWKQEITISAEGRDKEPGKIMIYWLHENMILLLIDIRSYKVPGISSEKNKIDTMKSFYINYRTEWRCELSMRDGGATFLECGEPAVDLGHTVQDNACFYYPNKVYCGVELCFVPGDGSDRALSMGMENTTITANFQRCYMEQNRLLITQPEDRVRTAFEIMEEDVPFGMPKEVLRMDVYRLLALLGNLQFAEMTRRTYYTDSQVKIARLAMKEISENLSKVIVALLPDSGDRYYSTPLFTE